MIITLKGADFSKNNIGPLSSWLISREIGDGARYSGPTYVSKGGAFSATVVLAEGYEIGSAGIIITMGGIALDESCYSVVDNMITFTINSVTGSVMIKVPTLNTNTGEEDEPEIPDTPTNYTFTINPDPTSATVTLSATGYSDVSGTGSKSITVANGTKVNWSVSADGYTTRTGDWTISGGNKTENITLVASGEEEPEVSTNYTLTINPTPSTATVTLTASGYTQNGNSITVANGTQVNWTVSASGYTEQNGIWVAEKTETKNITLVSPVTPGESYWVGEKISGKSIGSGKIKSTLNGYLAITDPTYVAELAGKTVEEIAIGTRSAAVADTAPVKIYLVDLNDPAPSAWVLKDTVTGLGGDPSTIQTNTLNTPFVVPSGYTLGYYSMSVMGNGELIEGYKHSDSYYQSATADTASTMPIGSIDFKVKA